MEQNYGNRKLQKLRSFVLLQIQVATGLFAAIFIHWLIEGFKSLSTTGRLFTTFIGGNLDFHLRKVTLIFSQIHDFLLISFLFLAVPNHKRVLVSFLFFFCFSVTHFNFFPPYTLYDEGNIFQWFIWLDPLARSVQWIPVFSILAILIFSIYAAVSSQTESERFSSQNIEKNIQKRIEKRIEKRTETNSDRNALSLPLSRNTIIKNKDLAKIGAVVISSLWLLFPMIRQQIEHQIQPHSEPHLELKISQKSSDIDLHRNLHLGPRPGLYDTFYLVIPDVSVSVFSSLEGLLTSQSSLWIGEASRSLIHFPAIPLALPMRYEFRTGIHPSCSGYDSNWTVDWQESNEKEPVSTINQQGGASRAKTADLSVIALTQSQFMQNWLWFGQANSEEWKRNFLKAYFSALNPIFASIQSFRDQTLPLEFGLNYKHAFSEFEKKQKSEKIVEQLQKFPQAFERQWVGSDPTNSREIIIELPRFPLNRSSKIQADYFEEVRLFARTLSERNPANFSKIMLVTLPQERLFPQFTSSWPANSAGIALEWQKLQNNGSSPSIFKTIQKALQVTDAENNSQRNAITADTLSPQSDFFEPSMVSTGCLRFAPVEKPVSLGEPSSPLSEELKQPFCSLQCPPTAAARTSSGNSIELWQGPTTPIELTSGNVARDLSSLAHLSQNRQNQLKITRLSVLFSRSLAQDLQGTLVKPFKVGDFLSEGMHFKSQLEREELKHVLTENGFDILHTKQGLLVLGQR